ncbi:hypothetical protein FBU30_007334 [Linnemannia zychae]|nr:hypothetical protein FBU30_007334 [Linnemannia zychae]
MVLISLRKTLLSLGATFVLASLTTAQNDPYISHGDPCGLLSAKNASDLTVTDVANCYHAIPFNSSRAETTLKAIHTLFRDYYIFTEIALNPRASKPFKNEPIDVLARLQAIGRTNYTNDFQFHADIYKAIDDLKDGHASYHVQCYNGFLFANRLALHAPVVGGVQQLRVFRDAREEQYKGCIVDKIDGQPSWDYIKDWSDRILGLSHDPNARLNLALATQRYGPETGRFETFDGLFATRLTLPESDAIEYQLRCKGSSSPIKVVGEWTVVPPSENMEFNSVESYIEKVCLRPKDGPSSDEPAVAIIPGQLIPGSGTHNGVNVQEFNGAEKILEGNGSVFYHLRDQPHIGVLHMHSFDIPTYEAEIGVIFDGLKALHSRNVTNLILDFQANVGGYVELANTVVQFLFPNKGPLDSMLEVDQKITKPLQKAAVHGYNANNTDYMDATYLVDLKTGLQYTNNSIFSRPIKMTRNGRKSLYTERTALYVPPISKSQVNTVNTFSWTNNPQNIRVITDGRCGSATGIATYLLTSEHNVESFVIGGTAGEDMSMFSFAGASVLEYDDFQKSFKGLNATSPLSDLPYINSVRFSWLEKYARNSTFPLEYDAARYRAQYHLDYSLENSFSREIMWKEVAALSWK